MSIHPGIRSQDESPYTRRHKIWWRFGQEIVETSPGDSNEREETTDYPSSPKHLPKYPGLYIFGESIKIEP